MNANILRNAGWGLAFAFGACGGGPTGPSKNPNPSVTPTIKLEVRVNRNDWDRFPNGESVTVVEGEAVVVQRMVTGNPSSCTTTGIWSQNICYGQTLVWMDQGPGTFVLGLRASNSAGSDEDEVIVTVLPHGTRHAVSNRKDETGGPIIRVVFMHEGEQPTEPYDMGDIQTSIQSFEQWFRAEGLSYRWDMYRGEPDVFRVATGRTNAEMRALGRSDLAIRQVIAESGIEGDYFAVYYDGAKIATDNRWGEGPSWGGIFYLSSNSFQAQGFSGAIISPPWEVDFKMGHELAHTCGVVHPEADDYLPPAEGSLGPGHMSDPNDLMSPSGPADASKARADATGKNYGPDAEDGLTKLVNCPIVDQVP